jgi:hypothetical protein
MPSLIPREHALALDGIEDLRDTADHARTPGIAVPIPDGAAQLRSQRTPKALPRPDGEAGTRPRTVA